MASQNPFSFDSFIVGNKEELAIFTENANKERIITLKNPEVTEITIEETNDFKIERTLKGEDYKLPQSQHIKATITIETINWESMWGDHVRHGLPDTVENMSVEELLHAVNQKVENR